MSETPNSPKNENKNGIGLLEVILSVLAAMFGVRSHEKHQRDFEQGDATQFIAVGILFVVIFVLSLIWVVDVIVSS